MNQQLVTTRDHEEQQFVLLTPGQHPPRSGPTYQVVCPDLETLTALLTAAALSDILAVDFETKGNDPTLPDFDAVGVALAWDTGSVYIPLTDPDIRQWVLQFILDHPAPIAHNVYFDGAVLHRLTGGHTTWHSCTYNLTALLANESPEQRWGLKSIMVSLLGWPESNDHDLGQWLVVNGYYIGNRRVDSSEEYLRAEFESGGLRPDKSEMWRAPQQILGMYSVLDAEACYLLYTQVLNPAAREFPELSRIHGEFMLLIELLIEQRAGGIHMDRRGLESRKSQVLSSMGGLRESFLSMADVSAAVKQIESEMLQPLLDKAPLKLKKDGGISKNWEKWIARVGQAESGNLPEYRFNIQSGQQLAKLLYGRLGYPVRVHTETGDPSTAIKALGAMGEHGRLLVEYNYLQKEMGFLEDYLERTEHRPTIHPSFRVPGTVTGRLSGKDPNLQQVPKTKAMMSLFQATPGCVWVDLDFSAIEPVVATEFSQDPNMIQIYGDGKPQNDIYLFVGAHIPGMGDYIRSVGYDPYNPSREALGRAKKECKHERSICKTVVLACIAEGELVRVRNKSWIPIEQITAGDEVWDGVQWVRTDGVVYNGVRSTLELEGVSMTPDHKVLGEDNEWREARKYAFPDGTYSPQQIQRKPCASWSDVWNLVRSLFRTGASRN